MCGGTRSWDSASLVSCLSGCEDAKWNPECVHRVPQEMRGRRCSLCPRRTRVGFCMADLWFTTHAMIFLRCGFVTHVWVPSPAPSPGPPSTFYHVRSLKRLMVSETRMGSRHFSFFSFPYFRPEVCVLGGCFL